MYVYVYVQEVFSKPPENHVVFFSFPKFRWVLSMYVCNVMDWNVVYCNPFNRMQCIEMQCNVTYCNECMYVYMYVRTPQVSTYVCM